MHPQQSQRRTNFRLLCIAAFMTRYSYDTIPGTCCLDEACTSTPACSFFCLCLMLHCLSDMLTPVSDIPSDFVFAMHESVPGALHEKPAMPACCLNLCARLHICSPFHRPERKEFRQHNINIQCYISEMCMFYSNCSSTLFSNVLSSVPPLRYNDEPRAASAVFAAALCCFWFCLCSLLLLCIYCDFSCACSCACCSQTQPDDPNLFTLQTLIIAYIWCCRSCTDVRTSTMHVMSHLVLYLVPDAVLFAESKHLICRVPLITRTYRVNLHMNIRHYECHH